MSFVVELALHGFQPVVALRWSFLTTYTVCNGLWPSYNHASDTGMHVNMGVYVIFTWPKSYFNVCALILYMCEGLRQVINQGTLNRGSVGSADE